MRKIVYVNKRFLSIMERKVMVDYCLYNLRNDLIIVYVEYIFWWFNKEFLKLMKYIYFFLVFFFNKYDIN